MEAKGEISPEGFQAFLEAALELGGATFYESASNHDQEIRTFRDTPAVMHFLDEKRTEQRWLLLRLHYSACGPIPHLQRISLDPGKADGHMFRYESKGWGLIDVQYGGLPKDRSVLGSCRVAVNSKKRAEKWFYTYSDHDHPSEWDWREVESRMRKLARRLKKIAASFPPNA